MNTAIRNIRTKTLQHESYDLIRRLAGGDINKLDGIGNDHLTLISKDVEPQYVNDTWVKEGLWEINLVTDFENITFYINTITKEVASDSVKFLETLITSLNLYI